LLNEAFRCRLEEYRKNWRDAVSSAGPDPVDRIAALVFALLDFRLLTRENLALWNSFWTEACRNASFNALSKQHDAERQAILLSLCTHAKKHFSNTIWTPRTVAHVLETMTEGAWSRLYYSPNYISAKQARITAGTLLSTIFPSRSADIMRLATESVHNDYPSAPLERSDR
jgi:TetR/AcrR family transcriptional regulator, transcriptional repressor of bet genes